MRALKSTNDFNNVHWFMLSDKKNAIAYGSGVHIHRFGGIFTRQVIRLIGKIYTQTMHINICGERPLYALRPLTSFFFKK
jgi:hypothetical protein